MTIDKDRYVKIPVWLVAVALPLVIALLGTYVMNRTTNARIENQVNVNTEKWQQLPTQLDKKVDRTEFDIIQGQLNRIESKLDQHITK